MRTEANSAVLTCPECQNRMSIAVVDGGESIIIPCDDCGNEVRLYFGHSTTTDSQDADEPSSSKLSAEVTSWEERDPRDPYSAHEVSPELGPRIRAEVKVGEQNVPVTIQETISGYETRYTVRAQTDSGQRSKDAYRLSDDDPRLYIADKGVPWDSSKRWTYLDRDECERRATIAGLGEVFSLEDEQVGGEYGTMLGEESQTLLFEDGTLNDDLVARLTKALLAFQSKSNPALSLT